ncbi:MAG: S8/S53 family peptidase [Candidatus Aminicenantes bacterium]|nr:MAG: S8/S53 family peptidase [Candidatus Aminicenantes bacterium]
MKHNISRLLIAVFCVVFLISSVKTSNNDDLIAKIKNGLNSGTIAYKLTTPEEIISLLGEPLKKKEDKDGGMQMLGFEYPDIQMTFWKMRNDPAPFTLRRIFCHEKQLDMGEGKKLVLRTNDDLKKIDQFGGLANISLVRLDLRNQIKFLNSMTFDTLTEWPSEGKLPQGFRPAKFIVNAKDPGLGVRALHEKGIDGTGVGIAIIDQPLLLGHAEYTASLTRYDETGLKDLSPQMHGSPVTSIAVGKNLGVAPGASLTYFAVPMWERDNRPYITALKKILEWNKSLPEQEKIRAVSISNGMFPHYPHYDEWKVMLTQMESHGILIVTCDPAMLEYGILSLNPGENPDNYASYKPGIYVSEGDMVRVPGANKTVASHRGHDVYTFDRMGGMSWGAPYIAGLAALAYQVNPDIQPKEIIKLLIETVVKADAGPIVNPGGFIEKAHVK